MKKLTALLLALAMCFALAACAPKNKTEESPNPETVPTENSTDDTQNTETPNAEAKSGTEDNVETSDVNPNDVNDALADAQEKYKDLKPKDDATASDVPAELTSSN